MIRTLDATALNAIANDDTVRPFIGDGAPVDLTDLIADPQNVALTTDDGQGGYVLHKLAPGLYEAHSLALPAARGKPMLRLMRDGFRYLFTATDALEVVTKVPASNTAADGWATLAGFRETFSRDHAWHDGAVISYRTLSHLDWALRDPVCAKEGEALHQWFHDLLGPEGRHPDDPAHNAVAGACMLGVKAGNLHKAVGLYNRWAVFAGYSPVRIVSEAPVIVDMDGVVAELRGGEMVALTAARHD